MNFWNWITHSNTSLFIRIALGILIFTALALVDYARHRQNATRWREYTLLLLAVAGAICYGVVNDQITSAISWEYFYYGKGLEEQLGPQTPPAALPLHLAAALVGIKATWSAGLLIGVALLLANNPSKRLPRLRNRDLLTLIPLVFLVTACVGAIGGYLGYLGLPARFSDDFDQMLRHDEWRPHRFMAVYGVHLGGYLGAALATTLAVLRTRQKRRALTPAWSPPVTASSPQRED
jgi:hypothetical protein